MELYWWLFEFDRIKKIALRFSLFLLLFLLETFFLIRDMDYFWFVKDFSNSTFHLAIVIESTINALSPWQWSLEVICAVIVVFSKRRICSHLSFVIFKILKLFRTIIILFILCWYFLQYRATLLDYVSL